MNNIYNNKPISVKYKKLKLTEPDFILFMTIRLLFIGIRCSCIIIGIVMYTSLSNNYTDTFTSLVGGIVSSIVSGILIPMLFRVCLADKIYKLLVKMDKSFKVTAHGCFVKEHTSEDYADEY